MWNISTAWQLPGPCHSPHPHRRGRRGKPRARRHVIELVDGLLITGGGDVHPRYYVPDPAKNRDALGLDDLAAMGCGSSSHCRSTGAKVPFCGHYVPDRTFEEAMDGTSAVETVESLDGRDVLSATGRPPIPCLDGLARRLRGSRRLRAGARPPRP